MTNTETEVEPIRFTQSYELDRERLFNFLIDPNHLKQWFSPSYFSINEFHVHHEVGGKWSLSMEDPSGSIFQRQGSYRVIEKPSKLGFTHSWVFESGTKSAETYVEIELVPAQNGSTLELTHQGFSDQEIRDSHEKGWKDTFDNLKLYLNG